MTNFKDEYSKIMLEYNTGKHLKKLELLDKKLRNNKVILYGAGALGAEFYRCFTRRGIKVECFCDTYKTGESETTGLPVISPAQLVNQYAVAGGGGVIIISTSSFVDEIYSQLINMGFHHESVIKDAEISLFFTMPYSEFSAHLDGYEWAYNFFDEDASKQVILDRIKSYLLGLPMKSHPLPQYFAPDLFNLTGNEIFVDAGFFDGDTTKEFIRQVDGKFKHIYGFEPDANNIKNAGALSAEYKNISLTQKGLWDKDAVLYFAANGTAGQITETGGITVPVTSIDLFFKNNKYGEYPTFIKMDIEGAEKKALTGSEYIIRKAAPKLAVCVYHKPEDIYELPKLMHSYNPDYKFSLRHYTRLWFETVCYAIPAGGGGAKRHLYSKDRQIFHEVVPLDTPFMVAVEPSSLCNIRCNYCLHSMDNKTLMDNGFELGIMNDITFSKIIFQLSEFPQKIKVVSMAWNGEPLLDKTLPDKIRRLRESGVAERITVTSNALNLTRDISDELIDSGLDLLNISLQGMSAKKYLEICGANIDFEEFYNNIVYFWKHKKNCQLGIKIANTSLDDGEENLFYQKFSNICDNIDVEQISGLFAFEGVDYKNITDVSNTRLTRYGEPVVRHNVCRFPFANMLINCTGKVGLCCGGGIAFDKFDVHKKTLHEIWNSAERRNFLVDQLNGKRFKYKKCKDCTIIDDMTISSDNLDGYEAEILERMGEIPNNTRGDM
jgi:FkbM family methyltransferase